MFLPISKLSNIPKLWKEASNIQDISWLNTNDRSSQCILSTIYYCFNSVNSEYFNKNCLPAELCKINSRSSFQGLNQPLTKSGKCLNSVSCSVPLIWNKIQLEIKGEKAQKASSPTKCKNYYLKKMEYTS